MIGKCKKLLEEGLTEYQIAKKLDIPIVDVYTNLAVELEVTSDLPSDSNISLHKPKVRKSPPVEEKTLKELVDDASKRSIEELKNMLNQDLTPDELAKVTSAIAKLHTTHFKDDTTNIVIQNNQLSTFRASLKS